MKEEILRLRKLGYSYKRIKKELNCALSTISYQCKKNKLNKNLPQPNKLSNYLIEIIKNECLYKTKIQVAKELNISRNVVYKYSKGTTKIKQFTKRNNIKSKCFNCNNEIISKYERKFCDNNCCSEYQHKQAYNEFLNNNEKYCVGYYTPKGFKDFFLKEQNNKCAICGNEPYWMNQKLVFVIDHIDGDCSNNKRKNLRLICPNCDSQTNTFKSKTKHSKRRDYIKENIIKKYGGNLAG